jgi:hypothetical protein
MQPVLSWGSQDLASTLEGTWLRVKQVSYSHKGGRSGLDHKN